MRVDWNQMIPTRRSLLSRIKHWDDDQSWRDFREIYRSIICGAAIKAGLTETEAEDVLQDTLVAVSRAIGKFKYEPQKCTFKTWLHSLTKRQVVNQFRRRLGKGRLLEPLPAEDDDSAPLNEIPDPASQALDETWEREYERTLLHGALERVRRKVSPAQFQIYDYYALQGHGTIKTARDLGVSIAKVYLARHRVGEKVRKEVAHLRTKLV
jgi:RNA polymerase sigma-70 factor (ECF subfamily)